MLVHRYQYYIFIGITNERLERDTHEKHLRALRTVKCSIDNRPPADHPHLARKLKTKKLQEVLSFLKQCDAFN